MLLAYFNGVVYKCTNANPSRQKETEIGTKKQVAFSCCPKNLCVLTSLARADAVRDYEVSGTVLTSSGRAVPGASVIAWPILEGEGGVAASLPPVRADHEGRFKLKLAQGSYQIRANDELHGYPEPSFLLSAGGGARFPNVKIEEVDIHDVHVILGERGGILRVYVHEQGTMRPIARAKVVVRDARDAGAFVELTADDNGNIQFAVPHKALTLVAEGSGYSSQVFQDGEVVLSSGDYRDLTFDLKRK